MNILKIHDSNFLFLKNKTAKFESLHFCFYMASLRVVEYLKEATWTMRILIAITAFLVFSSVLGTFIIWMQQINLLKTTADWHKTFCSSNDDDDDYSRRSSTSSGCDKGEYIKQMVLYGINICAAGLLFLIWLGWTVIACFGLDQAFKKLFVKLIYVISFLHIVFSIAYMAVYQITSLITANDVIALLIVYVIGLIFWACLIYVDKKKHKVEPAANE